MAPVGGCLGCPPCIEGNYASEMGSKVENRHITVPTTPGLGIIPSESSAASATLAFAGTITFSHHMIFLKVAFFKAS